MADTTVSIVKSLLQALYEAVQGVKANKAQCNELLKRCQRLAKEYERLPSVTHAAFQTRGVFQEFEETLKSGADFCRQFSEKGYFMRLFQHDKDACTFEGILKRLNDALEDTQLGLQIDMHAMNTAWIKAQETDRANAERIIDTIEQGNQATMDKLEFMQGICPYISSFVIHFHVGPFFNFILTGTGL